MRHYRGSLDGDEGYNVSKIPACEMNLYDTMHNNVAVIIQRSYTQQDTNSPQQPREVADCIEYEQCCFRNHFRNSRIQRST